MREYSEKALVPPATTGNLTEYIIRNAKDDPNFVSLSRRSGSEWRNVTSAEFLAEVQGVAKGLIASGVKPGDRVGIMSATRYEWTVSDFAVWYAGGVVVPIYETSSAEQVKWILGNSGAVGVFLEGAKHVGVFEEVSGDLPEVKGVYVFDNGALKQLTEGGKDVSDEDLEAARTSRKPEDLATIIYTSGTTGMPKGCMLSHRSFMFEVDNIVASLPELFARPGSSTLLFLPIAHVFGRAIEVGCLAGKVRLGHSADVKNLLGDLAEFKPTFLLSVPRVFEKIYNTINQKAAAEGKTKIIDFAVNAAIEYSKGLDNGGPTMGVKAKHAVANKLVYTKIRALMGGQVAYAVSGGAALGDRLGHFYRGIGITILEGYGLTETSAASTVNRPGAIKVGSVGKPLPGASVKIAEDGEILLHGPQIFDGYWANEAASKEVLEADGWFHSGDIGELDSEGFLRITGRKKDLIVTAGGKNVAPAVLEDRMAANWLVGQAMVVGDAKPFIAALVTIDPESLPTWLAQHNRPAETKIGDLVNDPELLAEVQKAVDEANKAVSAAEAIKKFQILDAEWTEAGGQLTPSMKLKRNVVMSQYASEVEGLYKK